jgi:hypothetical protein
MPLSDYRRSFLSPSGRHTFVAAFASALFIDFPSFGSSVLCAFLRTNDMKAK